MHAPELDVLDQLQGRDLPLAMLAALFSDEHSAKLAIDAMIQTGDVELLDDFGAVVPIWRWREIQRDETRWKAASQFHLRLTDAGAKKA